MAEYSNLIWKAKDFLMTTTSKEEAIAIDPLFMRQDTSEYKAARALYECCVANFSNFLIPKLLSVYQYASDGVLRFRAIHLLSETLSELRNRNFYVSTLVLRKTKPLLISCLKMKETKESDIKILRKIVSFVAYKVVMLDDGGWDELSGCILEFADSYPFRAFHVFLDLPLIYNIFINQDVLQRVLDRATKVFLSPEKAKVEDWSLALQTEQTPLRRRLPKRGFKNKFKLHFQPVGLGKIAKLINAGEIDSLDLITMKMLKDVGAIGKQIEDGVRLMGRGADEIKWPLHYEVSRVTVRAKEVVEAAGGSVRRVYYNKL